MALGKGCWSQAWEVCDVTLVHRAVLPLPTAPAHSLGLGRSGKAACARALTSRPTPPAPASLPGHSAGPEE